MNELLKSVLSLSLSGTLLGLLLFLLRALFKERLSKRWQYYIWLIVVFRLLFPFAPQPNLMTALFQETGRVTELTQAVFPDTQPGGISDGLQAEAGTGGQDDLYREQAEPANRPVQSICMAVWQNLWIIWLAGAFTLLIRKITIYQDFAKYIRAGCVEIADIGLLERFGKLVEQSRVNTTVELYANSLVSSPLLMGFFCPCIILPSAGLPPADFDYTIRHELTHLKRRDLFYKWLVQFAVCVHWFNPFVYRMSREIGRVCELSCDEAVIRELDARGRRAYGNTLLNAIGSGGGYKPSLAALTLNESKELLKERLDAIMNFKKKTKWRVLLSLLFTAALLCGSAFLGAYAAGVRGQTKPDDAVAAISLQSNSKEIIGFAQGEQAAVKEVALHITENDVKIQINVSADGDSRRTLEVIAPDGEVVRAYTFNQDGFISGSQEYLYGEEMIMVTDVVYPGVWHVRLSTDRIPAEKTSVTAKLIDPFVWGFASYTNVFSAEIEDEQIGNGQMEDGQTEDEQPEDGSPLHARIYDHYRTYEQTKEDIQNGYIVHTGASFSEQAMPTVTGGGGTAFYVNHENHIELSITLKNLIDGTGRVWTPDSFVSFEIYDPSGKTAYSFYKKGKEIETAVDIDTELAVYPGEWRYKINFAYTTNGIDPSEMEFALKYKTIFDDDIQWLIDHKLNQIE